MINFCIEFCTNTISNSKNEDVILKKNNILSLVELKNKILTNIYKSLLTQWFIDVFYSLMFVH